MIVLPQDENRTIVS